MKEETFISYRNYFWFWLTLSGIAGMTLWYIFDVPVGGRSGSTRFGYASGFIAAAVIVYLMWFGVRKRSYYAYRVTLKGWLAAHIWLGIALLILVPLHSAFDFGYNVHTLAYLFLVLVVLSGVVGAVFYRILPAEIISNRGGGALKKRLEDLHSLRAELSGISSGKSPQLAELVKSLDTDFSPGLCRAFFGGRINELDQKIAVEKLSLVPDAERNEAIRAISLISKIRVFAESIRNEIIVRAKLRIWLFLHVPLTLGLFVLLLIHIFSVFYYR